MLLGWINPRAPQAWTQAIALSSFLILEYFIGCSPVFLDNFPREVANDLLALMVPV